MKKSAKNQDIPCYCGLTAVFFQCCGKYIHGSESPETAEQLMRSRYSANVIGHKDYLMQSWDPEFRPADLPDDTQVKWVGLTIKSTEAGKQNDQTGVVEFVARYKLNGKAFRLHEKSVFRRIDGKWVYVNGEIF